jgi:hypothetical protein
VARRSRASQAIKLSSSHAPLVRLSGSGTFQVFIGTASWIGLAAWCLLAITIAFSTLAVLSAVLFRQGRWKTRVV